jgi:hypothetical protein
MEDMPEPWNPAAMERTGAYVLDHGSLPALPETVTHQMAVPVAFWTAGSCAVVLFLNFTNPAGPGGPPGAEMRVYGREGETWVAARRWMGIGWNRDPLSQAQHPQTFDEHALQRAGSTLAPAQPAAGRPAIVVCGIAAPEVTQLSVVQPGHEMRRRIDRHFDAWIVCMEELAPYEITALNDTGEVLGTLRGDAKPRIDDDRLQRLRKINERTAIVEALVLVSEPPQARRLVDIAVACADADQLILRVADEWGLTDVQARAIADTQVRLLTQERHQELIDELDHLKAERKSLVAELAV